MIKHIVMFYFTDKVTEENQDDIKQMIAESVNKIKAADLEGHLLRPSREPSHQPELLHDRLGSPSPHRSHQIHPEHVRHKDLTKDYCRDRVVFEWE